MWQNTDREAPFVRDRGGGDEEAAGADRDRPTLKELIEDTTPSRRWRPYLQYLKKRYRWGKKRVAKEVFVSEGFARIR